ncbi:MAG: Rieske 2Fe-2S domain-containing protein [Planctomycetota bacterium]
MPHDHPKKTTRRSFLDWLIALFSTIAGAAMAIPAMMYLWPAAKGGAAEDVEVKNAGSLKPGDSAMVQVRGKAVIVVREATGYSAYLAVCPHLGCLVKWEGGRKEFLCPCHAAVFSSAGQVVSGPAPGPLTEYKVKEVGGKVLVSSA